MEAPHAEGLDWRPMPHFINYSKCSDGCKKLFAGSAEGAKWTARRYVEEAREHGARLGTRMRVTQVLSANGRVTGIRGEGRSGAFEIEAEQVVLSAGGLGTAPILQASGFPKAGNGVIIDPLISHLWRISWARFRPRCADGVRNHGVPGRRTDPDGLCRSVAFVSLRVDDGWPKSGGDLPPLSSYLGDHGQVEGRFRRLGEARRHGIEAPERGGPQTDRPGCRVVRSDTAKSGVRCRFYCLDPAERSPSGRNGAHRGLRV